MATFSKAHLSFSHHRILCGIWLGRRSSRRLRNLRHLHPHLRPLLQHIFSAMVLVMLPPQEKARPLQVLFQTNLRNACTTLSFVRRVHERLSYDVSGMYSRSVSARVVAMMLLRLRKTHQIPRNPPLLRPPSQRQQRNRCMPSKGWTLAIT